MKLLITGGCGFLGSNLAKAAIDRGIDLMVLDDLSRPGSVSNLTWLKQQGALTFRYDDIRSPKNVSSAVKYFAPDVVFHLAGQVAMTTSIADPRKDFEVNVLGSLNLLESVRNFVPEATLIYSSTNKVYGDLEQFNYSESDTRFVCVEMPKGFDENVGLDFHSPYGCSKGAADQYFLDYARIFGLKTVVFRHSSMYGGQQFSTYDQGWVGWFSQKAVEAKNMRGKSDSFSISGTGKQVRDILHAQDIESLYFGACDKIDSVKGHAFNIGGGMENSLSLLELITLLEEITEVKLSYIHKPARASDQKVFVADTTKIRSLIDWAPQTSSKVGVATMLDWVAERVSFGSR